MNMKVRPKTTDINSCGPWGGEGGRPFSSGVGTIRTIVVHSGKRINRLELHFSDGHTEAYGTSYGGNHDTFVLPEGTEIAAVTGSAGDRVDSIQFRLTNNDQSALFGNPHGGKPFKCEVPSSCKFTGLFGRSGDEMDAIGIKWDCDQARLTALRNVIANAEMAYKEYARRCEEG